MRRHQRIFCLLMMIAGIFGLEHHVALGSPIDLAQLDKKWPSGQKEPVIYLVKGGWRSGVLDPMFALFADGRIIVQRLKWTRKRGKSVVLTLRYETKLTLPEAKQILREILIKKRFLSIRSEDIRKASTARVFDGSNRSIKVSLQGLSHRVRTNNLSTGSFKSTPSVLNLLSIYHTLEAYYGRLRKECRKRMRNCTACVLPDMRHSPAKASKAKCRSIRAKRKKRRSAK